MTHISPLAWLNTAHKVNGLGQIRGLYSEHGSMILAIAQAPTAPYINYGSCSCYCKVLYGSFYKLGVLT